MSGPDLRHSGCGGPVCGTKCEFVASGSMPTLGKTLLKQSILVDVYKRIE